MSGVDLTSGVVGAKSKHRREWLGYFWAAAVLAGSAAALVEARPGAAAAPANVLAPTEALPDATPSKETSRDCTACHQFDAGLSHPVDVPPRTTVPMDLPLEAGKITCLTCHDGTAARGHDGREPSGLSFLRTRGGAPALCASCHTDAGKHTTGFRWAHPGSRSLTKAGRAVDEESAACMSCHDGAIAKEPGFGMEGHAFAAKGEHVVGTPFSSGSTLSELVLVPKARLDRRVQLFDGRMGCGTCHSVYSKKENLLVMSNKGSALCLSCHVE